MCLDSKSDPLGESEELKIKECSDGIETQDDCCLKGSNERNEIKTDKKFSSPKLRSGGEIASSKPNWKKDLNANFSAKMKRMVRGEQLFDREMLRLERELDPGLLLKSGREICISGFKEVSKKDRNRALKWRVHKNPVSNIKSLVDRNRALKWRVRKKPKSNLKGLVRSDPERIRKKGYDRNQWFQDEEQSHFRRMVKKKFFRTLTSIHYTKERSVLEEIILGTY